MHAGCIGVHAFHGLVVGLAGARRTGLGARQVLVLQADHPKQDVRGVTDLRERVLAVRPGITDPVSLKFLDESSLLAQARDPEKEYCEVILPMKLREAARYADQATLWTDFKIIGATLKMLVHRGPRTP